MRATVAHRTRLVRRRTLRPMAGQLFEIKVTRADGHYAVSVPEIEALVHVRHRVDAEAAAREAIATRTGIPINFVAVWVRD
jgi:hypothetical protein